MDFGFYNVPEICVMDVLGKPLLFVNSAEILEEMYIKQNRYTDKPEESNRVIFGFLLGSATIILKGNEEWQKKRKAVSSAFYKEKLVLMTEKVKECIQNKMTDWDDHYLDQEGKQVDIIQEMQEL